MNFVLTEPDENFSLIRYQSNTWELGARKMLFGVRVSCNPLGKHVYTVDWCCGANETLVLEVLLALKQILESCNDNLSENELKNLLPFNSYLKYYEPDFSIEKLEDLAVETLKKTKNVESDRT